MRRSFVLCLILLFAFVSCARVDDVKIISVDGIRTDASITGNIAAEVLLTVENNSSRITIKSFDIEVMTPNSTTYFVSFSLPEPVKIGKGVTELSVPVAVHLKGGIIGAVAAGAALKKPENLLCTVRGRFKQGIFGKRIVIERAPLKDILSLLNAEDLLDSFGNIGF
ncbi:MAG TPA: hypothetical protein IAA79_07020 [Candidatus Avirikenella pullistercoris]|nr:hypothetical protein [Candidatus Avirikenella pullistercoris]